jgi:hypothetical protein
MQLKNTNMKNKTILAAALCISAYLCPSVAPAQTTNTLGTVYLNTLSLRNPAIQQTNTLSFEIGEGIRTTAEDTFQATTLRGLYLVSPKVQIGLRSEFDTLGTGGNSIAGISINGEARYLSDNLFVAAVVGYHRDIEQNTRNAEFGIGLGAFTTPNFCVSTELLMQYTSDSETPLSRAVVITASYRF